MLQYNKKRGTNSEAEKLAYSHIPQVFEALKMKVLIQPYLEDPVEDLLFSGTLSFDGEKFIANKPFKFKSSNGDFKWPIQCPISFANQDVWNKSAYIPLNTYDNADLRGGDTTGITEIPHLFFKQAISTVKNIDVTGGDTSKVTKIDEIFDGFSSLERVDLSSWDLSNLESASNAFSDTPYLEKITFNENLRTPNLTNVDSMFKGCGVDGDDKLKLDLSHWAPKRIKTASNMIADSFFREVDLRGGNFDPKCEHSYFADNMKFLKIFNGVILQDEGRTDYEKERDDWTRICGEIIMNPDKFSDFRNDK